jgi:hypothetical protein
MCACETLTAALSSSINLFRSNGIALFALDSSISLSNNGLLIECERALKREKSNEKVASCGETYILGGAAQRCEHEFRIIGLACVIKFLYQSGDASGN